MCLSDLDLWIPPQAQALLLLKMFKGALCFATEVVFLLDWDDDFVSHPRLQYLKSRSLVCALYIAAMLEMQHLEK